MDEIQPQIDNEPDEKVVMQLILTKSGQLRVIGSVINDKILSYGLLELAKSTLEKFWKESESKIIKSPGGIMGFVRNGKH